MIATGQGLTALHLDLATLSKHMATMNLAYEQGQVQPMQMVSTTARAVEALANYLEAIVGALDARAGDA